MPRLARPVSRTELNTVITRWRVSRRALGDRAPEGSALAVILEIQLDQPGAPGGRVEASLLDESSGAKRSLVSVGDAAVRVIEERDGLIHIEANGVLSVSIRPDSSSEGGARLLYARTPQLQALGLSGGRSEPVGVAIR